MLYKRLLYPRSFSFGSHSNIICFLFNSISLGPCVFSKPTNEYFVFLGILMLFFSPILTIVVSALIFFVILAGIFFASRGSSFCKFFSSLSIVFSSFLSSFSAFAVSVNRASSLASFSVSFSMPAFTRGLSSGTIKL